MNCKIVGYEYKTLEVTLSPGRPQGCEKDQRGGGEWQDGERLLHDGTLEQWQQPLYPLQ